MPPIRKQGKILASQLFLYEMALERLNGIKANHKVVSGRALFPKGEGDKFEHTNEAYKDWAKCSDQVDSDLDFCNKVFKLLFNEITEE